VNGPFGAGVATAPLLAPPSVEEFLTESQEGGAFFYPAVAATSATATDLCRFVRRWDVTAVIDTSDGSASAASVRAYFTAALGSPLLVVSSGADNVALYRSNGGCPTATTR